MSDYEVLQYGQQTGIILEAFCMEDAIKQIPLLGLQNRNNNLNLVEL